MNNLTRRVHRSLAIRKVGRLLDGNGHFKLTRLGTAHSGWTVPEQALEASATAVCIGAGEDISFDVELNKRGLNVVTLDPTPRAKKHVQEVLAGAKSGKKVGINGSKAEVYDLEGFEPRRFALADLGVWKEEKAMRFYAPQNKNHVSHSIVNLQKTEDYFMARCTTLRSACAWLNPQNVQLVKMDIEGAEYEVLRSLVKEGPWPQVLCVEFDEIRNPLDRKYLERIEESVGLLKKAGYRFIHLEKSNALFVQES
jgi:FkbM family methyltransferase